MHFSGFLFSLNGVSVIKSSYTCLFFLQLYKSVLILLYAFIPRYNINKIFDVLSAYWQNITIQTAVKPLNSKKSNYNGKRWFILFTGLT